MLGWYGGYALRIGTRNGHLMDPTLLPAVKTLLGSAYLWHGDVQLSLSQVNKVQQENGDRATALRKQDEDS
ncbi:hypothetical protein Taro_005663 [Colocasia esculenta]|uniref:Uncharacterized protein n=1 Tax=Colocasia esculenta TaxID=4460 RepID=A0A843TVA4_COLES|nr:hypothetical protein [Colocasia esculenta]